MSKYSFKFELKVVKDYLNREIGGYKIIAKKYDLKSNNQVQNWVKNYEKYGEENLKRKSNKTFYSGEFKLIVLKCRQYNNCSYREAANHFTLAITL